MKLHLSKNHFFIFCIIVIVLLLFYFIYRDNNDLEGLDTDNKLLQPQINKIMQIVDNSSDSMRKYIIVSNTIPNEDKHYLIFCIGQLMGIMHVFMSYCNDGQCLKINKYAISVILEISQNGPGSMTHYIQNSNKMNENDRTNLLGYMGKINEALSIKNLMGPPPTPPNVNASPPPTVIASSPPTVIASSPTPTVIAYPPTVNAYPPTVNAYPPTVNAYPPTPIVNAYPPTPTVNACPLTVNAYPPPTVNAYPPNVMTYQPTTKT